MYLCTCELARLPSRPPKGGITSFATPNYLQYSYLTSSRLGIRMQLNLRLRSINYEVTFPYTCYYVTERSAPGGKHVFKLASDGQEVGTPICTVVTAKTGVKTF